MLAVYTSRGSALVRKQIEADIALPENALWIDLELPTPSEDKAVEQALGISVPTLREMQEIAAEEAAAADLVVISVHQAEDLPDVVKRWADLWLRQKGSHQAVLLALLDPSDAEAPGSTEAYLRNLARCGGMEFLVESADMTSPRWQEP